MKIAMLATNGFSYDELIATRQFFLNEGYIVHIISPSMPEIHSKFNHGAVSVDKRLSEVSANKYNAILLPDGLDNPDLLRLNDEVLSIIKDFYSQGKLIGSIAHSAWLLADAGIAKGKKLTSFPSIKNDLINAGAQWINESVIQDGNIISAQKSDDVQEFNKALLEYIEKHDG